jgi:hypothetical protein
MANRSFDQFTKDNKYQVNQNLGYGIHNGYLVTLYQMRYNKMFIFPLPSITENEKDKVLNYLKEHKKDLFITSSKFDNSVLVINIRENIQPVLSEKLEHLVYMVTIYLKDNNIAVGKYCVVCGKENAETLVKIANIEYYAHKSCYDKSLEEADKIFKENREIETAKTTNIGFVGAFLGAFIVGIVWYLISDMGWLTGLIMFSAANFSLSLYYYLNRNYGKYTKSWVSLSVLITYLVITFLIMDKNDITYITLFSKENQNVMTNILLGFGASIIGLIPILIRYNKMVEGYYKKKS